MTTQHTPGPWSNNKWNSEEHQISAKGGTIALISHSHSLVPEVEADANARLIAAAPELLEALRELLDETAYITPTPRPLVDARIKARAAIAKAEEV